MIYLEKMTNNLWLYLVMPLLLMTALYCTYKTKYIQFRKIPTMIKLLFAHETAEEGMTPKQSLMLAMAGKIGVGSLTGVAFALIVGGPGAIFWMWVTILITSVLTVVESLLGAKYKDKNYGGTAYYLKNGLGNKKIGALYAFTIIFCYCYGFSAIQVNAISVTLNNNYQVPLVLVALILLVLIVPISIKGLPLIQRYTSRFIPIITFCYLCLGLFIIASNITAISDVLTVIVSSAFTVRASISLPISFIIVTGIRRAIFASEVGSGTVATISATTSVNKVYEQSLLQMFGTYAAIFGFCTLTAFIILFSLSTDELQLFIDNNINPNLLLQMAINKNIPLTLGKLFLTFAISFFAASQLLSANYHLEANVSYLFSNIKMLYLFKIILLLVIVFAIFFSSQMIWLLTDFLLGIAQLINLYAIIKLFPKIKTYID